MISAHLYHRLLYFCRCIAIETEVDPNNIKRAKALLRVAKEINWETFDTLYVAVQVEDNNTDERHLDKQSASGKCVRQQTRTALLVATAFSLRFQLLSCNCCLRS
jgi:hypothetical protein